MHLFLFIILRLPRPTLFPYTTLFRSRDRLGRVHGRRSRRARSRPALPARSDGRLRPARAGRAGRERARRDRKSTRLNSSHVKNSYAVFCLKKKILVLDEKTRHLLLHL